LDVGNNFKYLNEFCMAINTATKQYLYFEQTYSASPYFVSALNQHFQCVVLCIICVHRFASSLICICHRICCKGKPLTQNTHRSKDADAGNVIGTETIYSEEEECTTAEDDDNERVFDVRHFKHNRQQIAFEQQKIQADSNQRESKQLQQHTNKYSDRVTVSTNNNRTFARQLFYTLFQTVQNAD